LKYNLPVEITIGLSWYLYYQLTMKQIKLTNTDRVILVDEEDFERISKFNWSLRKECIQRFGTVNNRRVSYSLANQIMNRFDCEFDHADRDCCNNQKYNLREASRTQNMMNRAKWNKHTASKYKGVTSHSSGQWRARITVYKKQIYLGLFDTEIEAAKAYNNAAIEFFKEFACLNQFPVE